MIIISTLHKQVCFRVRVRVFVFFLLSVGLYVLCFVYVSHRFDKYSVLFLFTNNTHSHFFSLTLMLLSFYCLLFTHSFSRSRQDLLYFLFSSSVVVLVSVVFTPHNRHPHQTVVAVVVVLAIVFFFLCSSYSSYDIHMGFWLVLFLFCLMEDIFVYLAFRVNFAQKSELFMLVQVVCVIRSITFLWFLFIDLCVFWDFVFHCCYFTISYLIVLYRFSIGLRFFLFLP